MTDDPLNLFSPDGVTAMTLAAVSSLMAGLLDGMGGAKLFATTIGASVVSAVVMPIAVSRGYTWHDWLGVVCVLCGLFAGVLFGLANVVKRRWIERRGDEVADGLWVMTLGRIFKKKDT